MCVCECTNIPKSSSQLLPVHSPLSTLLILGIAPAHVQDLALLNFMMFTLTHLLSLSRSTWKASLPTNLPKYIKKQLAWSMQYTINSLPSLFCASLPVRHNFLNPNSAKASHWSSSHLLPSPGIHGPPN